MSISFDRVSNCYDATRGIPAQVAEHITDCMIHLVSATPTTRFFEPGIGTGRIALPFIQRGYAYTGLDISDTMMDVLRKKVAGLNHALTLVTGNVTALPFADCSFDVAIAVHLLHLVPSWRQALAELRRVLTADGIFLYSHGRTRPADPSESNFNPGWYAFEQQWQSILADFGFTVQYGASESDVLEVLRHQGAQLEPLVLAQWPVQQTVETMLQAYQQRIYSPCWQVPEAIFPEAIARLTQWCDDYFGTLDSDMSFNAEFRVVVVRAWAR